METSTPLGTELVICLVATVILFWGAAKWDKARKTTGKSAPPAQASLAIFSAAAVILIMALQDHSQPAASINPVAAVVPTPPAPAKSAAYWAGYNAVSHSYRNLIGDRTDTLIVMARDIGADRNDRFQYSGQQLIEFVQGYCDAYVDRGFISGGRFTVVIHTP
jgi:hypothetical protein